MLGSFYWWTKVFERMVVIFWVASTTQIVSSCPPVYNKLLLLSRTSTMCCPDYFDFLLFWFGSRQHLVWHLLTVSSKGPGNDWRQKGLNVFVLSNILLVFNLTMTAMSVWDTVSCDSADKSATMLLWQQPHISLLVSLLLVKKTKRNYNTLMFRYIFAKIF